jgi:hypothetical protein
MITVLNLREREPELARLKPNDGELQAFINTALRDFRSQFKMEYGYNPNNDDTEYITLIEFLTLNYVFESLIKTDDIYIAKADRYRNLYNEWFAKLNYNNTNTNTNGLYGMAETIGMLR